MTHENYVKTVFSAILRNLANAKFCFGEKEISFWPQEHAAIEYYLKDVAKRSVTSDVSQKECLYLLTERIGRLIKGEEYEWERLISSIREEFKVLSREELIEFDKLSKHFKKKQISPKKKEAV